MPLNRNLIEYFSNRPRKANRTMANLCLSLDILLAFGQVTPGQNEGARTASETLTRGEQYLCSKHSQEVGARDQEEMGQEIGLNRSRTKLSQIWKPGGKSVSVLTRACFHLHYF